MSNLKIILSIVLFFGTLAACAAFGFPQAYYDGEMTRSIRVLNFLVHTIATDNFGRIGGAVFYGIIGLTVTTLAAMGTRSSAAPSSKKAARPRARKPRKPVSSPPTQRERRRTFSATSVAAPQTPTGNPASQFTPSFSVSTDHLDSDPSNVDDRSIFGVLPPIAADKNTAAIPAWGLMLASPWNDSVQYTSWLGGTPCAPKGFEWPRDLSDGEPMHFYAQIDLAALKPETETGARPPGLPERGAMLVFIGSEGAVRIIDADGMQSAEPIEPPEDLPILRKFGYWDDGNTFPAWPIEPRAFLAQPYDEDTFWEEQDGDGRPAAFPYPHKQPADWITNWGMAALEAEFAINAFGSDMRHAQEGRLGSAHAHTRDYYGLALAEGPELLRELESWHAYAESQDPTAPVDTAALEALFEKRLAFCSKVDAQFTGTIALRGAEYKVWEKIWFANRGETPFSSLRDTDKAHRRFAEDRITDWRQHRLFGIEPPFSNNFEDLRGKSCLISIGADELLKTKTEHEYGISLWAPTEDLEAGRYDRLEIVRHCAV